MRKHNLVLQIISTQKKMFVLGILTAILYTVTVVLCPDISGRMMDNVLEADNIRHVYKSIVFFLVICLLQPLFGFIKNIIFLDISEKIVFDLRNLLFDKVLKSRYVFFESNNSGDILSRLTNDIRVMGDFVTEVIIGSFTNVMLIVLIITGMLIQSISITLVLLICFGVYYYIHNRISKKLERFSKMSLENWDDLCSSINQTFGNIMLFKTFRIYAKAKLKFRELVSRTRNINLKMAKTYAKMNTASGIIVILSLSLIYSLGSISVIAGELKIGAVIALGLYFQLLSAPIQEIASSISRFKEIRPVSNRINEYLELPEEAKEITYNDGYKNAIHIFDLTFSYQKDGKVFPALNNFNLKAENNGIYGIVGESGEGKSTLFKIIMALYDSFEGSIEVTTQGNDRPSISYVTQDIEFLNDSIIDNLLIASGESARDEAINLCKRLGLDDTIRKLPLQYQNIISESVNLSGGEKQRLALIRSILSRSNILLLDEVTSSLDSDCKQAVMELLQEISQDTMILLITHDADVLGYFDQIYEIKNGRCYSADSYYQGAIQHECVI